MVRVTSLIQNAGLLTTLSAQCYIKYKANVLEDEFCSTFVNKVIPSDADIANQTVQTPSASLDLMSEYLDSLYNNYSISRWLIQGFFIGCPPPP